MRDTNGIYVYAWRLELWANEEKQIYDQPERWLGVFWFEVKSKKTHYWLNSIIIRYANVERNVQNDKRFILIATLDVLIFFSSDTLYLSLSLSIFCVFLFSFK